MARGPKKHLKRLAAPSHWCLAKLGGVFAPRPRAGPHKLRECIPMAILIRNKLKYALTYNEVIKIVRARHIKVDHKVRTDLKFPLGFMDVVTIPKTNENFRIMMNTKGRYVPHKIKPEEATFKICKVKKAWIGTGGVAQATLHDGRCVRFIHPDVKEDDSVKFDLLQKKIVSIVKFRVGSIAMVTGGNSVGRIGIVDSIERHPGTYTIVTLRDSRGESFATRKENVFILGEDNKCAVTLPKGKGIKLSPIEEQEERYEKKKAEPATVA